ncbi:hypothetical protein NFI96_027867 [Prochilodus magdalenae]|nr:hypothetical protein NFI96_027867 [Prochilodus magdalenae]
MRLFRSPSNTHCSSDEQNTNTELLYVPADCTLSQTQEEQITRYPGESVLLPCSCTDPNTRPGSVKWERVDPGGTEGSSKMELSSDRVKMINENHPSNLSLLISDLTEQDQGTYRCSINNKQSINIRLSITGCTLSQTQENQIIRYPGESVLLPCSCNDTKTRPLSVKWEMGGTEVSNKTVLYSGRVQMFNKSHPTNLSLLISNLTEQDQGTYRCSINNQSISIRLSITGCTLSQTQENQIIRYPGESVLLPCSCNDTKTKPGSVKWEMGGTEVSSKMEIYSDRVQMFNENLPSNLSLLISNLTEQDQGTYRCSINDKQSINIRLSITGCTLSQNQTNQIIRYPGESVLLPCSCTDPNTRPLSVKWEIVDSGGTEGSSKMEIYSDRVQMFNRSHPSNLSLLISNLTEQDQGTECSSDEQNTNTELLYVPAGCTLSQTQENQIIRYPGESVLLPCSCTDPDTRPLSVKWERVDSGGTEGQNKTEPDSDRVQMFNKSHPADLSLLISNLTEQDQGTYRCSINNKQSINIRLSITDCTLSQTQTNQIIGYPGESVLLPCSCTDPNTRPLSVKWERVDSGGSEGSSKTVTYSDRVQMSNNSHPADFSLLISNLTEHDQGTYRCSINNNQSINISLSIKGN